VDAGAGAAPPIGNRPAGSERVPLAFLDVGFPIGQQAHRNLGIARVKSDMQGADLIITRPGPPIVEDARLRDRYIVLLRSRFTGRGTQDVYHVIELPLDAADADFQGAFDQALHPVMDQFETDRKLARATRDLEYFSDIENADRTDPHLRNRHGAHHATIHVLVMVTGIEISAMRECGIDEAQPGHLPKCEPIGRGWHAQSTDSCGTRRSHYCEVPRRLCERLIWSTQDRSLTSD
jgi:hypothetical protein